MATLKVANIHFDAVGTTLIRANGANTLTFNTAGAEDVRIDATGNVLIGRTDSTVGQNVKLDVNGAINASAVLINGSVQVSGGNYVKTIYNSPATWTKNAGLKGIRVVIIAGGGAGGNGIYSPASFNGAGGGGSGGGVARFIPAPNIPGPVAVTVGSGGTATPGTGTGGSGGTSSFGSFASATGGGGGTPSNIRTGGAGGTITFDAPLTTGEIYPYDFASQSGFNGVPGEATSGNGGSVLFANTTTASMGQGGPGFFEDPLEPGNPGSGFGSGGSGGTGRPPTLSSPIQTPRLGGTGSPGVVIIEEFY